MGGLSLDYLRKIRGQPTTIETAFSGFSHRFLHLFLAGFVSWLLISLGFICFILPGLYLLVAWWFALTLVVDKQLDFWSAMEVSRKVVTRHWWKFFGFLLLVLLLYLLGIVVLLVGFFIAAPLAMIAATYAYEDIFGAAGTTARLASAGVGPSGTVVMPGAPPKNPFAEIAAWKPGRQAVALATIILVAAVLLLIALAKHRSRLRAEQEYEAQSREYSSFQESIVPTDAASEEARRIARETLKTRLEAASAIGDPTARTAAMAGLATDSRGKGRGEVDIVKDALQQNDRFHEEERDRLRNGRPAGPTRIEKAGSGNSKIHWRFDPP